MLNEIVKCFPDLFVHKRVLAFWARDHKARLQPTRKLAKLIVAFWANETKCDSVTHKFVNLVEQY